MIRHEKNPLITPDMVKPTTPDLEVMGAFNAGATMLGDETTNLVITNREELLADLDI